MALLPAMLSSAALAQITNAPTTLGGVCTGPPVGVCNAGYIPAQPTFIQILAPLGPPPAIRRSITIQNNMTTTDSCWIYLGTTTAANTAGIGAAILLAPGQAYTRYFPYVPSDAIQATCGGTTRTLYVDTQ